MVEGHQCSTPVILLMIGFPWRHALPQYSRVLRTYAFRSSDLAYIDMTIGPVTDIALLDSSQIESEDMLTQPQILVGRLSDPSGSPFRFKMKTRD